ncbi:MAG: hypothetical protein WC389_21770 [Lutibacter sp.]|jgi:hypothetical protein
MRLLIMLCECGCGNEALKNKRFLPSHNLRCLSPESKQKQISRRSEISTNTWKDEDIRERRLKGLREYANSGIGIKNLTKASRASPMSRRGFPKKIEAVIKQSDSLKRKYQEDNEFRLANSLRVSKAIGEGKCGNPKVKRGYYLTKDNRIIYLSSSFEKIMVEILDESLYSWSKCKDIILYKDIFGDIHSYTPDFKVFLNELEFVYVETKGYVDKKCYNKFNDVNLYTNIPIYLIFEKDLKYLNGTYGIFDITQFQTIDNFVRENYEQYN